MNKFLILSVFTALVFVLSFPIHDAHAVTFAATKSGNWDDSATWSLSAGSNPPTTINSGDTVTIPSGLTITIQSGVTITNSGTISNSGTIITYDDGSVIINSPSGTIANPGTISNNGGIINTSGGTIINPGTLNNKEAILNYGTIINPGTINNNGMTNNYGTINNPGNVNNAREINTYCSSVIKSSGSFSGKPIRNLCGPLQSTNTLIVNISKMNLSQGTTDSLDAKINPVIFYLNNSVCEVSQIKLKEFITEVQAQAGNMTPAQNSYLISTAQNIKNSYVC